MRESNLEVKLASFADQVSYLCFGQREKKARVPGRCGQRKTLSRLNDHQAVWHLSKQFDLNDRGFGGRWSE